MINKVTGNNNISFKQVVLTDSIINMKPQNIEKLNLASTLCDTYFPKNDVFLMSDSKGELVYEIQKRNPLFKLLDNDILEKMGLSLEEMGALINTSIGMQIADNEIHNKKVPSLRDCTQNIDELDQMEIAYKLRDSIVTFNEMHPEDIN